MKKIFKCENCDSVVNDSDKFCPGCGLLFDESIVYNESLKYDKVNLKNVNKKFPSYFKVYKEKGLEAYYTDKEVIGLMKPTDLKSFAVYMAENKMNMDYIYVPLNEGTYIITGTNDPRKAMDLVLKEIK